MAGWRDGEFDARAPWLRSHLAISLARLLFLLVAALLLLSSCLNDISSSGLLYVANLRSSDVSMVDVSSMREVGRFPVATNPHEFVALSAGILVSNYRSATVTTLAGDGTARSTQVGGEPHGLAVAGTVVAVTQGRQGTVAILDVATLTARAVVQTGGELHTATSFGGMIYVVDAAGGLLLEIDPLRAAVTRQVRVGDIPESVAVSPDGQTVAVANARSGDISLVDRETFVERTRADARGAPVRVLFMPDGQTLAAALNDTGAVALLKTASSEVQSIIPVGERPDGLALSPDGRQLFVSLTGANEVAVVDLRERRVTGRIAVGDGPSGLLVVAR